jgi:hypothetical protein
VIIDSLDMFSNETGIYVYGDNIEGNYTQKDELWEREMHIDFPENMVADRDILEKRI